MAKKKLNPARIPIKPDSVDFDALVTSISQNMVLRAWALVLSSYANFSEASTESIVDLWNASNAHANNFGTVKDIRPELEFLRTLTGREIPFEMIPPPAGGFHTQGELNRFARRLEKNAVYATFAVLVGPIVRDGVLSEEDACILFRRALLTDEELDARALTVQDLLDTLEDEFGILLCEENGTVRMGLTEENGSLVSP